MNQSASRQQPARGREDNRSATGAVGRGDRAVDRRSVVVRPVPFAPKTRTLKDSATDAGVRAAPNPAMPRPATARTANPPFHRETHLFAVIPDTGVSLRDVGRHAAPIPKPPVDIRQPTALVFVQLISFCKAPTGCRQTSTPAILAGVAAGHDLEAGPSGGIGRTSQRVPSAPMVP